MDDYNHICIDGLAGNPGGAGSTACWLQYLRLYHGTHGGAIPERRGQEL